LNGGIRQTEIDIVQDRDASGTHRSLMITLPPNQPRGPGNEIVIELGHDQPSSSTIYGTGSFVGQ
jgi:hypothetical protein